MGRKRYIMAKNTNARYTYISFAEEVQAIVNGKLTVTDEIRARVNEKAQALIDTQTSKKTYNAEHPKKSTAKGASADTQAKADAITAVLPDNADNAMTAAEINAELGTEYTALQVANAIKFIEGATSIKVIRDSVNAKGLKAQKEYTAYFKA